MEARAQAGGHTSTHGCAPARHAGLLCAWALLPAGQARPGLREDDAGVVASVSAVLCPTNDGGRAR